MSWKDPAGRESASEAVGVFRRYVTDYVNRHDFSVIADILTDDYTLFTAGTTVTGRDGPYRSAVAKQLEQFPGLVFTPHDLLHVGNQVAVRFTEHGRSMRHGARPAAWPSIGIYTIRDGRLASCAIEQDYFGRRRQLEFGASAAVDQPALSPWDTPESAPSCEAEDLVRRWLAENGPLTTDDVMLDDSRAHGSKEYIVENPEVEIHLVVAGPDAAAFHATQSGSLAGDFATDLEIQGKPHVSMAMSGFVRIRDGKVVAGHVLRDRWGLYRRLARAVENHPADTPVINSGRVHPAVGGASMPDSARP